MNKFLTFAGTQPVYLGDIDFVQNAAGAAFTQLARALMNSVSDSMNAILQGVDITRISNSEVSYSAGVVVINGEILPVAGETISSGVSDELYFHVVSVLSGDRTFKDGNTHECYDTRSAVLNTVSSGGVALSSVERFQVNDDAVYTDGNGEGIAVSGKLIRKNGFWFAEFALSEIEGGSMDGSLSFSVSDADRATLEGIKFPAQIILGDDTIHPAIVQIVLAPYQVVVTITDMSAEGYTGTGTNRILIPIA